MAIASLCGGLALANAKLGAVHGFAGPLGGEFPAPHGAVCGRLLPHVMEANLHALRNRAPESERLGRFNELGPLLTGDPQAGAVDAVAWLHTLVRDLAIPHLGTYGLTGATLPALAKKARTSSSMQGNPIALTQEELIAILEQAT
jgi:alcohol dehydrogenase class IV